MCRPKAYNPDLLPPGDNQACTYLPLVCEELWKHLVNQYTYTTVKVVIEPRPHIHLSKPIFTCSKLLYCYTLCTSLLVHKTVLCICCLAH